MPLKLCQRIKKEFSVPYSPLAGVLGDDLIIEIFFRLPADSLFRFKSVSKQWNKVIASSSFAHSYRRKNPNPILSGFIFQLYSDYLDFDPRLIDPIFFITHEEISPIFIDDCLTFLPNRRDVGWCDSDKGLILYSDHARNFFVCNPLTTQCVAIPILPEGQICRHARLMCQGKDKDFHFKSKLVTGGSFALLNGIVYWIDWRNMGAFSVDTGHIRIIDVPKGWKNARNMYLRMSCGSLCLTCNKDQEEESDILIWILDDKGDIAKWTLQHSVSVSTLMEGNPEILDRVNYYKKHAINYVSGLYFFTMAIHHLNPQVIFLKLPGLIVLYDIDNTMSEVVWDDEEVYARNNLVTCITLI